MKQIALKITSVCFVLVLLLFAVTVVSAEEVQSTAAKIAENGDTSSQLTINDEAKVNVGDTVKFTLYLSEVKDPVIGFEMRIFYDNEFLEYQEKSLDFEKFEVVFFNESIAGRIPMNWTDFTHPADFSDKSVFLSADFKVLKGGNADISYFITEIYGEDMTYLKSYKWTYDITVNDEKLITDGVLPVSQDKNTLDKNQGSFINYVDGMGEENSPNSVKDHPAVVGALGNNQNYEGVTYNVYEQEVQDITKVVTKDSEKEKGGMSSTLIFIIIAIPVLVVLIGVALFLVNKNNKKPGDLEE